jgi:hypothetical protein
MMPSGNTPTCIGTQLPHLLDRSGAVKVGARIAGDEPGYTYICHIYFVNAALVLYKHR